MTLQTSAIYVDATSFDLRVLIGCKSSGSDIIESLNPLSLCTVTLTLVSDMLISEPKHAIAINADSLTNSIILVHDIYFMPGGPARRAKMSADFRFGMHARDFRLVLPQGPIIDVRVHISSNHHLRCEMVR